MITNPPIPTIYELTWQIGSCFKSQLLQVMWEVKGKSGKALTDMIVCLPWQKLTIHVGKLRPRFSHWGSDLIWRPWFSHSKMKVTKSIPDASHNKPRWCFWRFWYERRACESRETWYLFLFGERVAIFVKIPTKTCIPQKDIRMFHINSHPPKN